MDNRSTQDALNHRCYLNKKPYKGKDGRWMVRRGCEQGCTRDNCQLAGKSQPSGKRMH